MLKNMEQIYENKALSGRYMYFYNAKQVSYMFNRLLKKITTEVYLIILILIGLFAGITVLELRAEEPRRAIVAMEMLLRHNYIVPKIHGWFYYNKPPLFNWILACVFKLTGSNSEVWVRLPSIIAYLLTALVVFKIVKLYVNKTAAAVAAFLVLLSADTFFYGTVDAGEIDIFYMFVTFVQCIAIHHFGSRQKWLAAFLISYIATAAGILTKGLPSIAFQGITLVVWLLYTRNFLKLFSWQHLISIVVCIALVGTYFYAYSKQANLPLYLLQLTNEATQQSGIENKNIAILYNVLGFPFTFFYITFPSSMLLLYVFNSRVRQALKNNSLFYFSLLFIIANILLYVLASRTPNRYLYPFFPFLAIMGACTYQAAIVNISGYKWLIKYKTLLKIFIVIAVLRIVYDVAGMPYQQSTSPHLVYRKLTDSLLLASANQPIYLTGFIEKIPADPTLPFVSVKADTLTRPPLIPPQIPYYLTHKTGQVMRFDAVPVKGLYYLSPVDFLKGKNADIHYRFFEFWLQRNMALVTFK